jgi:cyclopropane fatty-acyl-phospholipid synthase-like methyltransferase
MSAALRVLSRSELGKLASVTNRIAEDRWRTCLSRTGHAEPPLLALLDDWSEFAGIDYRTMLVNTLDAQARIDQQWLARRPDGTAAAAAFYDETDTLIPLLTWWHGTDLNAARCATAAAEVFTAIGARRVVDFGCGIGSTSLLLSEAGMQTLLTDVAEEPLRFAIWRLRERGHRPESLNLLQETLEGIDPASCDGAVAFDVFEHLPDPTSSLAKLDRALAHGGTLCLNQAYVPHEDELQHFPQRGEVLRWLHEHGYRLAHVPSVCWIAQKAPLSRPERIRQHLGLGIRRLSTHVADGQPGPIRRRVGFHIVRHALR